MYPSNEDNLHSQGYFQPAVERDVHASLLPHYFEPSHGASPLLFFSPVL